MLTLASVSSYIDAGRLRPLGVATTTRTSLMPDVPTIAEAGVSGYKADLWYGLFAPAGTPSGAIEKLNAALNQALESPELLDTLKKQGYETRAGTPQQLHELLVADVESSARTIADAKIPRLD